MKNATWSGRFKKSLDKEVLEFSESVSVDHLLFDSDIKVCMAHAQMLCECKIITKSESNKICKGLQTIQKKYNDGKLSLSINLEDVHMNIEQALTKEVGDLGKKIHMGRSRNDLVSTDLRLYLRDCVDLILKKIKDTRYAIAITALDNSNVVFPGYTHMQLAQPITFGHHLLAWHEMLQRDEQRLDSVREVINVMPLGSAALSGTPYPIDRKSVAKKLGFKTISANSMDAVSDRDFVCDFAYSCSMVMMHLSRISEELIYWMNTHIKLVDIDEAFCTGSSIMPQKKNPDVPELIRGKCGSAIGALHEHIDKDKRLYLGGFSQGAALSLSMGLNNDIRADGIIAISGYVPSASKINIVDHNKDIYVAHGKNDTTISIETHKKSVSFLEKNNLSYTEYVDDCGHTISKGMISSLSKWMYDRLQRAD